MSISPEDMELAEPQEFIRKNYLSDVCKTIEASRKYHQQNQDNLSRHGRGMTLQQKSNNSTTGETKRHPLSVVKAGMKQQRLHPQNIPFDLTSLMRELKAIAVTCAPHLFDHSVDASVHNNSPINNNSDMTYININIISDEENLSQLIPNIEI